MLSAVLSVSHPSMAFCGLFADHSVALLGNAGRLGIGPGSEPLRTGFVANLAHESL
jgi:hypothetical protein